MAADAGRRPNRGNDAPPLARPSRGRRVPTRNTEGERAFSAGRREHFFFQKARGAGSAGATSAIEPEHGCAPFPVNDGQNRPCNHGMTGADFASHFAERHIDPASCDRSVFFFATLRACPANGPLYQHRCLFLPVP